MPDGLRSLEFVEVGSPGNAVDDTGIGAVPYVYRIGKTEVTAAQWVVFLNAKAKADRDGGLWNNDMDTRRSGEGVRCDIHRDGEAGSFAHSVAPDKANRPVTHVSFLDACRFCNWLHNGQGDGDTEDGAYTLNGYFGTDGRRIRRNPDARFFVPNEDEWYKAAYFDPAKSGGAGYWDYPTRSDAKPGRDFGLDNAANHYAEGLLEPKHFFSEAGAFARSLSASGTLDQAGNACEWTEALQPPFLRGIRGGAFDTEDAGLNIPTPNRSFTSISDVPNVGIRVAATVPGTTPQFPVQPAVDLAAGSAVTEFARRPWRDPLTGKPFFPLAWYSYQSDEADLDDIAREGGNLVLFVNTPCDLDNDQQLEENLPLLVKYLDHAQKCGVRVLVQTGGWYGAHMRGDAAEIARQRKFVAAIREHPALFGYQLYDEPEYKHGDSLGVTDRKGLDAFVGGMSALRDSLREWDPNPHRMISVVFNLVPLSSWTAYLPVVDSFHVDRYPLDKDQAYFGHRGDWGPLMMAWSMSHGAAALGEHPHLLNPAPCMQGVGSNHVEVGSLGIWRNPLYEETRYMAYSSLTVGSWGVFHWIRKFG
ncbi:MAG: SUMF1/EgtB/PvdO family nonheme iron enzyme, partial [Verrucomicrobia bacterium]|nr:SUMF1/EgtB/PvdO family nonheme iron enzyme [Verrucomicrobiota bacterium]